nr:transcription termination/antitermination NusG family protein [uncultured Roseococcus sp.]
MLDETGTEMAQAAQTETIAPATGGNVSPPDAPTGTDHPKEGSGPFGATAQDGSRKRWYAVQHHPFLGGFARLAIRQQGFRVHWPREMVRERRRDDTLVPLFRCYLFVEFDLAKPWSTILRAGGVVTILGIREFGAPAPARPGTVERLIRMAGGDDDGWVDSTDDARAKIPAVSSSDVLEVGSEVEVLHGPLVGRRAVTGLDRGRANIEIMMQMFGMECRASVSRARVKARAAA